MLLIHVAIAWCQWHVWMPGYQDDAKLHDKLIAIFDANITSVL